MSPFSLRELRPRHPPAAPSSPASVPSPRAPTRPARLPFSGKSLPPGVRPQVRAALRSASRARLLPSRPSRGSVRSCPGGGRPCSPSLGAGSSSGSSSGSRSRGPRGAGGRRGGAARGAAMGLSRSAWFGDARLQGLSQLTASRGAGAGAGAGAPAGAEPGQRGAGATCLPRSAGGAGGAPLAPSCTYRGDLSASPGVRAPHSHRPPLPSLSARRLLPPFPPLRSPPPIPSPRRPGLGNKRAGKRFKRPDIPGCAADAPPAL